MSQPTESESSISRRQMLTGLAASGIGAVITPPAYCQRSSKRPRWQAELLAWLESLARDDGGYAWPGQDRSHLMPTFGVIGCYHVLGQEPPRKERLSDYVRHNHPFRLKKLERDLRVFEYQQIQSLGWLGQDTSQFKSVVQSWREPARYPAQYERHGYPVFQNELKAFSCRALLELPLDELSAEFVRYLEIRRRDNGSFNNTPADDGSDGHVMNTWWGIEALAALGRGREQATATTDWLRRCQGPGGGFTWQPEPQIGGAENVAYTWGALRSLHQLGGEVLDRAACLEFIQSLRNSDGGFGGRPGWESNPLAASYALDSLVLLEALDRAPAAPRRKTEPEPPLPAGLSVFSIQIEAHGKGSPQEAVDLARALKIHLWGAKNAEPGWIERAQQLADEQRAAVRFFVANEEYGTWLDVPGMGTYSHTSDIIAPAGRDIGASLAGRGAVTWPEFRQRRLEPLNKGAGRLVWQFGENEELTRILLDESVARGGFAAISTFHFGNPDFTNSEPFLYQYRLQLPFIALQDAHGNEPWWFADMTTGFRTLFLATEPTWEGWLEALKNHRVVAVRHDAVSGQETWMHGGTAAVRKFVRDHSKQWQWWDNPAIDRPLVSIVAVRPQDRWEVARPEQGVTLRVRCAWQNTAQGQPKRPITELVKLVVDDREVASEHVSRRRPRGARGGEGLEDVYHQFHIAEPGKGRHRVTATVRELESGRLSSRTIEFEA